MNLTLSITDGDGRSRPMASDVSVAHQHNRANARRIATMQRIIRAIEADPLQAHRHLGNLLLGITWGFLILGFLIGMAVFAV